MGHITRNSLFHKNNLCYSFLCSTKGLDLYKSTTFFSHFFLSFLFSSYQEYFWLKVVFLKLSERHTKMLENNCEDRLMN